MSNWKIVSLVGSVATSSGGSGSTSAGTATPPGDVTAIAVTGFIDPISAAITLSIGVTPPVTLGTFIGCHLYLEAPDQSATAAFSIGTSALGGSSAVAGTWIPIDCGLQPYVAAQQPWTITVPGAPGLDPTIDTPCRIYAVAFSTQIENKLVQANQASPSPSQTFTLVSLASGTPTSGTGVTTLTTDSGQVGIVCTALAPDNSTGKLITPFIVLVTNTPAVTGWTYQLVITLGGADPTLPANQIVVTGLETQAGPVYAGADGIQVPHSFTLPTPTNIVQGICWLQAGLVDSSGNFQTNNIVPGITPMFPFTYGSTIGTLDASAVLIATIATNMAVVNGLLSIAPLGVTNDLLGTGAVATINIQGLAITNPLLASLAVQAANLATGSVTATAIAALAVGTAAIQNTAITNALIANLAVGSTKIQTATITNVQIATATIAGANIASATITQANLANLSVGTAQIQTASITNVQIATATILDANIASLNVSKLLAGTATFTGTVTFGVSSNNLVLSSSAITLTAGGVATVLNGSGLGTGTITCTGLGVTPGGIGSAGAIVMTNGGGPGVPVTAVNSSAQFVGSGADCNAPVAATAFNIHGGAHFGATFTFQDLAGVTHSVIGGILVS